VRRLQVDQVHASVSFVNEEDWIVLDIEARVGPHVVHAIGSPTGVVLDSQFEPQLKYFLLCRVVQYCDAPVYLPD